GWAAATLSVGAAPAGDRSPPGRSGIATVSWRFVGGISGVPTEKSSQNSHWSVLNRQRELIGRVGCEVQGGQWFTRHPPMIPARSSSDKFRSAFSLFHGLGLLLALAVPRTAWGQAAVGPASAPTPSPPATPEAPPPAAAPGA